MVKNRLLQIRLSLGYKKQKEFAKYLGVPQVSYNKWENNTHQPGLEMLLDISEKLNIKIEDIIYKEGEK